VWTVEDWDANDGGEPTTMLVHRDGNQMDFLEMAFVDAAFTLRAHREDAFEDVWNLINHLNDDDQGDGMTA